MVILGNMHNNSKVMKVIEHHMPISHSPCRRRSKGPLLSCSILAKATVFGRFRGGPGEYQDFELGLVA